MCPISAAHKDRTYREQLGDTSLNSPQIARRSSWPAPRAFSCKLVDPRCSCATQYTPAVTTDFATTEVIHQNEDDVRSTAVARRLRGRLRCNRLDCNKRDT